MQFLKQDNGGPALNICACGKVHLSYGTVTFHFETKEFTFFANAIARLYTQYQRVYATGSSHSISSNHADRCH